MITSAFTLSFPFSLPSIFSNSFWTGAPRFSVLVSCPRTLRHVVCWHWKSNCSPLGMKITALPIELPCRPPNTPNIQSYLCIVNKIRTSLLILIVWMSSTQFSANRIAKSCKRLTYFQLLYLTLQSVTMKAVNPHPPPHIFLLAPQVQPIFGNYGQKHLYSNLHLYISIL